MKFLLVLTVLSLLCCLLLAGCASTRQPQETTAGADGPAAAPAADNAETQPEEKAAALVQLGAKMKHPLYGYGSARGKVEQMARLQARQLAELDVANQLAGKPFTYTRKDDLIEIKTRLNLQVPGVRVIGEYQLAKDIYCVIVQSAALVEIAGQKNAFSREFTVSLQQLDADLRKMEMETIRAAVDAQYPGAKQVTGKIYFSGLKAEEQGEAAEPVYSCQFSVVTGKVVKK